jgi:hypothetical protein
MVNVFSTLMGAEVGAVVGALVAGAWVGAAVACGPPGAAVAGASVGAAAGPHAVRITSMMEITIIKGLRFDWYISSSGKMVWKFAALCKGDRMPGKRKEGGSVEYRRFASTWINIERRA